MNPICTIEVEVVSIKVVGADRLQLGVASKGRTIEHGRRAQSADRPGGVGNEATVIWPAGIPVQIGETLVVSYSKKV